MRPSPGAGHPVSVRYWPPSASTGRGVEVMATALEGASVTGQAGGVSAALAGPATRQAAAPANRIAPERRKDRVRSEEHTSELQSLMRISYAGFCLKKKKITIQRKQQCNNNDTKKNIITDA